MNNMTSKERIQAAVHFQRPDVIPVGPYMANHCSVMAGYKLRDCYTDGKTLARAQHAVWEIYGQDILTVQADNCYIVEAFPCKITYPKNPNALPSLIEPPLKDWNLLSDWKLPDPVRDGRMPVYIESMRELRHLAGPDAVLRSCGVGPFTLAAILRGTEAFLMDLAEAIADEEEEAQKRIHGLIGFCTKILIRFATAMLEAGADIVQCADSLASLDMISPEIYANFAFPYEKKFFEAMKAPCREKGAFRLLHICGDNTVSYPLFKQLDMDILELDSKVKIRYAREQLGEKHIALIGNLAPVDTILQATPAQVYREACQAIEDAGGLGFILGSGCEVPIAAPKENIEAMIRAARDYRFR